MDTNRLADAIRIKSDDIRSTDAALDDRDIRDAADLLRVLDRMVEGVNAVSAFGAPGDWGYESEIGKAIK